MSHFEESVAPRSHIEWLDERLRITNRPFFDVILTNLPRDTTRADVIKGIMYAGPTGNVLHTTLITDAPQEAGPGLSFAVVFAHKFEAHQLAHLVRRKAVLIKGVAPGLPLDESSRVGRTDPETIAGLQTRQTWDTRVLCGEGVLGHKKFSKYQLLQLLADAGIADRLESLKVSTRVRPGTEFEPVLQFTLFFDSWLKGAGPARDALKRRWPSLTM